MQAAVYGKELFQVNITFKIAGGVGVLAVALLAYKVFDHFRVMNVRSCPSSCIANLKQIDGAKATWALEEKKDASARPTDSDLFGMTLYIRDKPECPEGGHYTYGPISEKPRCSIPYHSIEVGDIYVRDETSNAISRAAILLLTEGNYRQVSLTDTDGFAFFDSYAYRSAKTGKVISPGYRDAQFFTTNRWPLRVVLHKVGPESGGGGR